MTIFNQTMNLITLTGMFATFILIVAGRMR